MNRTPIPVAMITDGNFVMQTVTAITSLLESKAPDTRYDIRVIAADCPEEARAALEAPGCVTVVPASTEAYGNIRQLAHIPIACLLKFDLCKLLPDCDRILYLDGDILVRSDLSSLYGTDLEGHMLGAVPQTVLVGTEDGKFSAGIMLFDAKRMREEHVAAKLREVRRSLGDQRSMDQQSFNLLFEKDYLRLAPRYNCCPMQLDEAVKSRGIEAVNAHFGTAYRDEEEALADAAVIHFATGQKPWKFSNIRFADAWYACYEKTAFGKEPLARKRYTVWVSRLNGLEQAKKTGGFAGVCRFFVNAFKKKVLRKEIRNNWG